MDAPEHDGGVAIAAGALAATARDWARIGALQIDGTWDGTRLLDASWVDASSRPEQPFLRPGRLPSRITTHAGFGYHWWPLDDEGHTVMADGMQGQFVYVDRPRRIVVVKTSAWPYEDPWWDRQCRDLSYLALPVIADAAAAARRLGDRHVERHVEHGVAELPGRGEQSRVGVDVVLTGAPTALRTRRAGPPEQGDGARLQRRVVTGRGADAGEAGLAQMTREQLGGRVVVARELVDRDAERRGPCRGQVGQRQRVAGARRHDDVARGQVGAGDHVHASVDLDEGADRHVGEVAGAARRRQVEPSGAG